VIGPQTVLMEAVVWVSEWEMACCGEPFSVGDRVSWHVVAEAETGGAWQAEIAAAAGGSSIDYCETHHEPYGDNASPLTGTVVRIRAIIRESASSAANPIVFQSVPGTVGLRDLAALDRDSGWSSPETLLDGTPVPPPRPEDFVPVVPQAPVSPGIPGTASFGWFVSTEGHRPRRHRATEGYLVDLVEVAVGGA